MSRLLEHFIEQADLYTLGIVIDHDYGAVTVPSDVHRDTSDGDFLLESVLHAGLRRQTSDDFRDAAVRKMLTVGRIVIEWMTGEV